MIWSTRTRNAAAALFTFVVAAGWLIVVSVAAASVAVGLWRML